MRIGIIYPNLDGTAQSLDMGVVYLATYLKERTSHQVKIIDLTFHKRHWRQFLRQRIREFEPDIIGISIVSLFFDYAKAVAREVKQFGLPIIVGGFQATMSREETIAVKEIDALCIGDGEYTLKEYLNTVEQGGNLKTVKGLWFKEGGRVIKNEPRDWIADLDALPIPDYDLLDDIDKYLFFMQRLYVIGSRGCPYLCTFCAESVLPRLSTGKRFRVRNARKYVQEVAILYKKYGSRGMRLAHVYDSVFTFDLEWLKEWTDEYKKLGLSGELPYSVFLKADSHNATQEKIRLLVESYCLQVRVGIEAGDTEIRNRVIKKISGGNDFILEVLRECNRNGLIVKTYCIFGIPGETKKSMQATFNFCKSPFVHIPLCFSYTPIPGTPLAELVEVMHERHKTEKMYSFHFSKGARLKGVPKMYVPWLILKTYIFFGSRLAWNTFLANPVIFFPRMFSRILMAIKYGAPLSVATGHALINPEFYPNLSKRIRKKWERAAH
jgi:radical SAM superfamily enzyme YgiQ (UPF0313 family)